jgi:hypothetical protein
VPTVEYIRPSRYPIISIDNLLAPLAFLHSGDFTYNPPHKDPPKDVGYYAYPSGPNLQKIACPSFVRRARTIELQSTTPSYPKAPQRVTLGVRSDSKDRHLSSDRSEARREEQLLQRGRGPSALLQRAPSQDSYQCLVLNRRQQCLSFLLLYCFSIYVSIFVYYTHVSLTLQSTNKRLAFDQQ